MQTRWRASLGRVALLAAFAGVVAAIYIPIGFNPTDEGLVTAQAYRLLHGAVPHVDVISPRPLGSPLLHTIDFLLPLPLLDSWRLIAVLETTLYTVAFAALVFGRRFRDWRPVELALVAVATLVNLNTFPLASWHTRDGLLFTGLGFWVVDTGTRRDAPRLGLAGVGVAGVAALMKQSFAPAALVALVLWVWRSRERVRHRLVAHAVVGAAVAAAPMLLYLAVLAGLGGAGEFLLQARSGKAPNGLQLFDVFGSSDSAAALRALVIVIVALLATVLAMQAEGTRRLLRRSTLAGVLTVAALAALVTSHGADELNRSLRLWLAGDWAVLLWWLVAAVVIAQWEGRRQVDTAGVLLLAAGWMTALSWGITTPTFLGGSLLLFVLARTWEPLLEGLRTTGWVRPAAIAMCALCVAIAVLCVDTRRTLVNRDRSWGEERVRLKAIDHDFGHARTNATTGAYLAAAVRCVRSHPARWTSILPDNPALYPILGLRNPLPVEWFFPTEFEHSEDLLRRAARRVDQKGDYAVLLQRVGARDLPERGVDLAAVEHSTDTFAYPDRAHTEARVARLLTGQREDCGPFLVIWKPAAGH